MIITVPFNNQNYKCDLHSPIDISIAVGNVKCFYATDFKATPYRSGDFIGSVKEEAPVNFFDVVMNPHGNGTHTECLGHITEAQEHITDSLKQYHHIAKVLSVSIENRLGDQVITSEALKADADIEDVDALIIRTLPNGKEKLRRDYSGSNPPYLSKDAMEWIYARGIKHLLLDLPSVDREEDDGKLENHRIFWNVKGNTADQDSRHHATITELIYVPNYVEDGLYLLNIQVPTMALDAAPSKPVLYQLFK